MPPQTEASSSVSSSREGVRGREQLPLNADGFVRCPRCGEWVNPLVLSWPCYGTHHMRNPAQEGGGA